MATISKAKFDSLLTKAPTGITPEQLVEALEGRGHTVVGVPQAQKRQVSFLARLARLSRHSPALSAAAGGLIGGVAGGPLGAITGAGVGGMYGQAVKSTTETAAGTPPPPLSQVAIDQAHALARGGSDQAMGFGLSKAITPAAKFIMARGLSVPKKLKQGFPGVDIPEEALRAKVPVGLGGLKKAEEMRDAAGAALDDLYAKAGASGTRISWFRLADAVTRSVEQSLAKQGRQMTYGEVSDSRKAVVEWIKEGLEGQNLGIVGGRVKMYHPPSEVKNIKQIAQEAARKVYDAVAQKQLVPRAEQESARLAAGIAKGSREALEQSVTGAHELESKATSAIAVARAVNAAQGTGEPAHYLSKVPLFLLLRYGLVPGVLSRAALVLNSNASHAVAQQLPRTLLSGH